MITNACKRRDSKRNFTTQNPKRAEGRPAPALSAARGLSMSDPHLMLLLGGFMGLVIGSALTGLLFTIDNKESARA